MARKSERPEGGEGMTPEKRFIAKRTGKEISRMQRTIKITRIAVLVLLLLVLFFYFLFYLIDRGNRAGGNEGDTIIDKGDFTVQIDSGDRELIALSEHEDLSEPTLLLQGTSVADLWDTTLNRIPVNVDEQSKGGDASFTAGGGQDNPEPCYLCYTFYVMNVSSKDITYRYTLDFVEKQLDLDEAVRIMIYRNGERKIYGKAPNNGGALEAGTIPFLGNVTYAEERDLTLAKGANDKYTVVIWLEGTDPECTNDLFNGTLKLEMNYHTASSKNY